VIELVPLVQIALKTVILVEVELSSGTKEDATMNVQQDQAPTQNGTCFPCEPGCDLCDIQNKTRCLRCTRPRVVYQGDCLDACPEGWHINKPPGDGSACRPW